MNSIMLHLSLYSERNSIHVISTGQIGNVGICRLSPISQTLKKNVTHNCLPVHIIDFIIHHVIWNASLCVRMSYFFIFGVGLLQYKEKCLAKLDSYRCP